MTEADIIKYFTSERNESLLFVVIGIIAGLIACYGMFAVKSNFSRGLFYPLFFIALVQVTVGGRVYMRTPSDIERVKTELKTSPVELESELRRMTVVISNFLTYRYIEIAFGLVGLFCIFSFKRENFWFGLGLGLFIQAAIMLCADYIAEHRAVEYTELIKAYINNNKTP
jgi:hypothetical protein